MTSSKDDEAPATRKALSLNTGVSVALMIALVAGIAAQLSASAALSERTAVLETQGLANSASANRIETALQMVAGELRDLRIENSQMRERLSKVEAGLERDRSK